MVTVEECLVFRVTNDTCLSQASRACVALLLCPKSPVFAKETSPMDESTPSPNYIALTADIVSAYVTKNSVRPTDIPDLINSIHGTLAKAGRGPVEESKQEFRPPVPIKKSITPDYIISLEDGKQYRSMKRHLSGRGLTPDQYRQKWNLPRDYPMVAPNYAKKRSELAKSLGLGQIRKNRAAAKAGENDKAVKSSAVKGRPKRAA